MTIAKIGCGCVQVLLSLLCLSCGTSTYREVYPVLNDGKYDSEFPYRGCSEQLERIASSVRMVSTIAYYKSYTFPLEAKVRLNDLRSLYTKEQAVREVFLNRTASGTATIIHFQNKQIAFLTCAHVVKFEDTVVSYYRTEDQKPTPYIASAAFKDKQSIYVASVPGARNLEILVMDQETDLAILGQKIEESVTSLDIQVFSYPFGRAKELEWGAFVYLFGYPSGFRILTKAIVSDPNRDRSGAFLTDAVFNKGFSGGIVLAVRDGVPNFELVGMVRLVPAHREFFLSPVKEGETIDVDQDTPYTGKMYVDSRNDIQYGIAPAVSAESIADFIDDNQKLLSEKGYNISLKKIGSKAAKE